MKSSRISEIVAFKLAEFFAVVIFATVLFFLFPELAYISENYRSLKSNLFGSFFIGSIFYFFLLFGPISIYIIAKFDRPLYFVFKTSLTNAFLFLVYACLVSYLFSQKPIRVEVIASILLLSIVVFIFGLGYLALRNRLNAD
jgi:hypothetical protein